MKDNKGLYYHPNPTNAKERMYVRARAGNVEFRLANDDHPEVWERHGWITLEIVRQAASSYGDPSKAKDIERLYDESVARLLIKEAAGR